MDKIYSRKRIILPKLTFLYKRGKNTPENKRITKKLKITTIIIIAMIVAVYIMKSISPIVDKQCINIAKSIATKISNEQATLVMSKYKYEDLCTVTKDNMRKYKNDKCKCNTC